MLFFRVAVHITSAMKRMEQLPNKEGRSTQIIFNQKEERMVSYKIYLWIIPKLTTLDHQNSSGGCSFSAFFIHFNERLVYYLGNPYIIFIHHFCKISTRTERQN